MTATELKAHTTTQVMFHITCPVCERHKLTVALGPGQWSWDGQTLSPSIHFDGHFKVDGGGDYESVQCKGHFTITNGQVNLC